MPSERYVSDRFRRFQTTVSDGFEQFRTLRALSSGFGQAGGDEDAGCGVRRSTRLPFVGFETVITLV